MLFYFYFYFFVLVFSLIATYSSYSHKEYNFSLNFLWLILLIILVVIIGGRYEVGGDWLHYLHQYQEISSKEFSEIFQDFSDPGFQIINWLSYVAGFGFIGVNVFSSVIFSLGLIFFCRNQNRPLLALAISIPYIVIVVSMGYTRQAVALGFIFFAIINLFKGNIKWSLFWVMFSVLFHKSAILMLPIVFLAHSKNIFSLVFFFILGLGIIYGLLLLETYSRLIEFYTGSEYKSDGAIYRLSMNMLPSFLYLIFKRNLHISEVEEKFWTIIALISILFFGLLFIVEASTALDRVALYFLPIQIFFFANSNTLLRQDIIPQKFIDFLILSFYGLVLFIWINFSFYSRYWIPYKNIILELIIDV